MKNRKIELIIIGLCFAIIGAVFFRWFIRDHIIGGDWPYFFSENIKETSLIPPIWAPWQENGLGGINLLLGLQTFQSFLIVVFSQWLGIPWNLVYKIGWFGLFLCLSGFSAWKLTRTVLQDRFQVWHGALSGLIYLTNAYVLMLVSGGQMGVALAYAVAPLVLTSFFKLIVFFVSQTKNFKFHPSTSLRTRISNFKMIAEAGLALAIQVVFDPRIAYVTMIGVGLYVIASLLHCFIVSKERLLRGFLLSVVAIGSVVAVAVLLNAFWLLPMVLVRGNPLENLGPAYTSADSLKFFSFADFSHALSLLHPNWPENMFGKTYFLQPEFLVLPILAFGLLLLISNIKNQKETIQQYNNITIHFFALLALIGAFLAKGVNPPFGEVYRWLFSNVPGFVMFRDPTKFYILIAVAYSVLIPCVLNNFVERVTKLNKKLILFPIAAFLLYWIFTIRPVFLGDISGTFVFHQIPSQYTELKNQLVGDKYFYRTLWIPMQQRFAFASYLHPAVEAYSLFNSTNSAQLAVILNQNKSQKFLENIGVRYLIIPDDSLGEIFLEDRKYSEDLRDQFEEQMDNIKWLKKISAGGITVYETPSQKELFWLTGAGTVNYTMISPTRYKISLSTTTPVKLIFSENYHDGWATNLSGKNIRSVKTDESLNSFIIPAGGNNSLYVYFEPEKYYILAKVISFGSFAVLIAVLLVILFKERFKHKI